MTTTSPSMISVPKIMRKGSGCATIDSSIDRNNPAFCHNIQTNDKDSSDWNVPTHS